MRVLFVVNDYSFFVSHRLPIAKKCIEKGWDVHVASPAGDRAQSVAKKDGLKWHGTVMDPGSQNPIRDMQALWDYKRIYEELRPDLLHHVTVKPVLYGSIAARLAGVPAVVNALSGLGYLYINHTLKNKIIRLGITRMLRYGFRHPNQQLILQNDDDKQLVLGYKLLKESDITIIRGSGVNTDRFEYVPETNSSVKVVLPARMLWDKGVGEFVQAAKMLIKEGVDATFHLLGTTDPKNPQSISLEQLQAWNKEPGLFYEGFKQDMVKELKKANIVCLPSYREGLPKALLEAASVGRPIVTTNAPGCREVVEEGWNGFLVPIKSVDKLAERIEELSADSALRETFGRRSREKAVQEFSIEHVVKKTLNTYQELIK